MTTDGEVMASAAQGRINIPCPHCGKKTPIDLGELNRQGNTPVACASCRHAFGLDGAQARRDLEDADRPFINALKRLGWR